MFKQALITAVTLASLFAVQTAEAAGPAGIARGLKTAPAFSYISEKRRTTAPFAHVMFCAQNPNECVARGGASEVSLSAFASKQLRSVNASVNRSIRSVNDRPDEGDVWQVNVKSGDCEDFALTKRDHLIAMGWSPKALRIAVTEDALWRRPRCSRRQDRSRRSGARQPHKRDQRLEGYGSSLGDDPVGRQPAGMVRIVKNYPCLNR